MLKVMTIVGTRPELIKLSRVISVFDHFTEHLLVHTGQNYDYELNQIFFDDLEIRKPDYFLEANGDNAAQTIARVIEKADQVLDKERPDAVLLYGDTNSCLAVIAAKRRKIPIFHMEAGNRCFDQRVPEELNRKVLDHLSDINLVLTEHSRRYLIAEGIRPEMIIKTGSHMHEVLTYYSPKIEASEILKTLELQKARYFLVSAHREENVDAEVNLRDLLETVSTLANEYDFPVIVSTHPRTRKRLEGINDLAVPPLVRFLQPFSFTDYNNLQLNAFCVISDSGTITEESDLLGFPAVMIRNTHERPEGMDASTLVMAGLRKMRVLEAVRIVTEQHKANLPRHFVEDYRNPNVSGQVIRIVESYVDYVNRSVWKKDV